MKPFLIDLAESLLFLVAWVFLFILCFLSIVVCLSLAHSYHIGFLMWADLPMGGIYAVTLISACLAIAGIPRSPFNHK